MSQLLLLPVIGEYILTPFLGPCICWICLYMLVGACRFWICPNLLTELLNIYLFVATNPVTVVYVFICYLHVSLCCCRMFPYIMLGIFQLPNMTLPVARTSLAAEFDLTCCLGQWRTEYNLHDACILTITELVFNCYPDSCMCFK